MVKIKPECADFRTELNGFGGIRCDNTLSDKGATEMRNFRIRADGSLEKRGGWRDWITFPDTVRGFWQGNLNRISRCFAVAGNQVWSVDPTTAQKTGLCTLTTGTGRVFFHAYRGVLYLSDGAKIYRCRATDSSFTEASGYAPLLGINWSPTYYGDILEPLNLFCRRFRVHYGNTTGATVFRLPYYCASIDRLSVNNTVTTDYTFTSPGNTVTIPGAAQGGSVEIAATIHGNDSSRALLEAAFHGYVYRDCYHETFFRYGGSDGSRIYRSEPVNEASLNGSRMCYPDSDPLYFTSAGILPLGDDRYPVTALCRYYERILAFSNLGAWSLGYPSDDSEAVQAVAVHSALGCASPDAVLFCAGRPVSVSETGIWQFQSTAKEPEECKPRLLSEGIGSYLTPTLLRSAITRWDSAKEELWIRDPADADGTVWVWNAQGGHWTCFDDIPASFFFTCGGSEGFASGCRLCLLDETLNTDGGAPITATYQSGYLSFSHPEARKRVLQVSVCADTDGSSPTLTLETESETGIRTLTGSVGEAPEQFLFRFNPGRFRFLRFLITSAGSTRTRFYSISLYSNA